MYSSNSHSEDKLRRIQRNYETNISTVPYTSDFLNKLSQYVNENVYIYGSVLRTDYNPKSDIDVCIFSKNVEILKTHIERFIEEYEAKDQKLQIPTYYEIHKHPQNHTQFKKIVWLLNSKKVAVGYKMMYKNKTKNICTEISIYNKKNQTEILKEHYSKIILPFYATIMLYILKYLFYDLNIIPRNYYTVMKRWILSTGINRKKDDFLII